MTSGDIVEGVVVKLLKFGAIVKIDEKTSALLHISEISDKFIKNVSDALEVGQEIQAKVISIEDDKIALSMKALKPKQEEPKDVDLNFEDKLSKFLKESNQKIEQVRIRQKNKGRSRSRSR